MNVTTHEIGFESLDGLTGVDSLCVFVSEDERPLEGVAGYLDWRLCGQLSRVLIQKFFTGEHAAFSKEAADLLLEIGIIKQIPDMSKLADPRFVQ